MRRGSFLIIACVPAANPFYPLFAEALRLFASSLLKF